MKMVVMCFTNVWMAKCCWWNVGIAFFRWGTDLFFCLSFRGTFESQRFGVKILMLSFSSPGLEISPKKQCYYRFTRVLAQGFQPGFLTFQKLLAGQSQQCRRCRCCSRHCLQWSATTGRIYGRGGRITSPKDSEPLCSYWETWLLFFICHRLFYWCRCF